MLLHSIDYKAKEKQFIDFFYNFKLFEKIYKQFCDTENNGQILFHDFCLITYIYL